MKNSPFQIRAIQVANFLREELHSGRWERQLPSERLLAAEIGISRNTLRAALLELEREGVLLHRGQRETHIRKKISRKTTKPLSVAVVLPAPADHLYHRTRLWMDDLRRILYAKQIRLEVYEGHSLHGKFRPLFFRKLIKTTRHDCFVVAATDSFLQRWCADNSVPTVIIGTVFEGISLPSVDTNYRAVSRHAVGEMLRHGHRRLAFIVARSNRGGDIESSIGFQEGVKHPDALATIEYYDGTMRGLCRLVDQLVTKRAMRPTAWLIATPGAFLTVFTHLLRRGIKVPEQISLISLNSEPFLEDMVPEPTRYVSDMNWRAKQVVQFILKTVTGQLSGNETARGMADLVRGETLTSSSPEV